MDKDTVYTILMQKKYFDIEDLRYNNKIGLLFSKDQLSEFLKIKDELVEEQYEHIKRLPLKTFNSKYCFYVDGYYLEKTYNEYLHLIVDDFEENKKFFFNRHFDDIIISRIFSEIEGSLNVENVPTTHKRIKEIFENEKISDKNDIIIKNMINGIRYITQEKPAFNKENLYKLYNLLSENCLKEDDMLKQGNYYRDDLVYVGGYEGAKPEDIDEMMNSLFSFVNNKKSIETHSVFLPLICHYYILYVHPYFDYNGRTARMVSFWLSYINGIAEAPLFISEAINEEKNLYYKAITNTRDTNNDLTYFLGYILEIAIKYSLVYKNVEEIKSCLAKNGDFLTPSEQVYLKKIIIHNPTDYFNHKLFLNYINSKMSIPGCMKTLNSLVGYNILIKNKNKKGETIYKMNQDMIKFRL